MALVSRKRHLSVVMLVTRCAAFLMPQAASAIAVGAFLSDGKLGLGNGTASSSEVLSIVSRGLLRVQEHKSCFPATGLR